MTSSFAVFEAAIHLIKLCLKTRKKRKYGILHKSPSKRSFGVEIEFTAF